uniref:Uncharacterized protein n=1 Tax=Strigamia maritima TaxID=126957 RepID=T1IKC6_STRMM
MVESRNNYPGICIYFEDDVIETIEEFYSYTLIPFICDVGGNLGLFLGLCIPTMIEIIQSCWLQQVPLLRIHNCRAGYITTLTCILLLKILRSIGFGCKNDLSTCLFRPNLSHQTVFFG